MIPKISSFEEENIEVDYITFKFQHLEDFTKTKLAKYFLKIGFNSYQQSGRLKEPIRKPIFVQAQNKYEILFVIENSHWDGTLLHFIGRNAALFYNLVQKKLIEWGRFSDATLGRLDLVYSRKNKGKDKTSVYDFFQSCQQKLRQSNQNVTLEKNKGGLILKIGNRRSNQFSRIYQKNHALRFEHEMKGKFLQEYNLLFTENRLKEFEHKLSSHFLSYLGRSLPLEFDYLDWLILRLRPIRKQPSLQSGLKTDYIESEIKMETRPFVNLLQFLNYAQHLNYEIDTLGETRYRRVIFKLRDFLEFQDPTVNSTNKYRLGKLKEFFQQLQSGLYRTSFKDRYYRSLVIIPQVEFEICPRQKFLMANVWVVEDLFYYQHPFILPDLFRQKLTKSELEVRLKIIQILTEVSIEKVVNTKNFFQSYSSTLNNQQKTKIKESFLELIKILEKLELIESKYKIISKGRFLDVSELTSQNISEGFVFYEKLSF